MFYRCAGVRFAWRIVLGRKGYGLMAHVLVVDDDATIRRLLTFAFSMEGHTVETLSDGRGALESLRAAPDRVIVFMDLMMPHLDGYAVCQQLESEPRLLELHAVVVMSAALHVDAPPPTCARETLAKPFDLNRALALVERLTLEPERVITQACGQDQVVAPAIPAM